MSLDSAMGNSSKIVSKKRKHSLYQISLPFP